MPVTHARRKSASGAAWNRSRSGEQSNGLSMDSTRMYLRLLECGDSLVEALAKERKANSLKSTSRKETANLCRWRMARVEVVRAADVYAASLQKYLKAILSDAATHEPASPQRPAVSKSRKPVPDKDGWRRPRCLPVRNKPLVRIG